MLTHELLRTENVQETEELCRLPYRHMVLHQLETAGDAV